ncbi:hypothetical protein DMH04_21950 [Kibdelosporangium aridum]|uniref:Uncharacterized protein n=1 Tax=Kibdelosporangium aridum TaxID=2030 RepID=A0A428Z7R0_KIBAR|nr:hypothetical protein DMH04_21950 [Kibdelosporangium aridum]
MSLLLLAACGQPALPVADGPPNEPTTPAPTTTTTVWPPSQVEPDIPPNHVDNNAWKEPKDMTEAATKAATALIERIRPELEKLRAKNDFSLESTRRVLASFGYKEVDIQAMRVPLGTNAVPPPGAAFGFAVEGGCVSGAVTPDGVNLSTSGPVADWGCNLIGPTH